MTYPLARSRGTAPRFSEKENQLFNAEREAQYPPTFGICGLHELVERRAGLPTSCGAVVDLEGEWSYAELNRRANRIAWKLKGLGVGPEECVAVCMAPRKEMIAALLGVWKAGGAFVPIDPSCPEGRLKQVLAESNARALLRDCDQAGPISDRPIESINVITDTFGEQLESNPPAVVSVENAAYIIFTSGSMGAPKGVTIPHRAIIHHNTVIRSAFNLHPQDRVLQFCSPGFDVMVEEVFTTLAAGAILVMKTPSMMESVKAFLKEVEWFKVTILNLPTAFWQHLIEEMADSGMRLPPLVRLVVAGGEKVPASSLMHWQQMVSGTVRWMNGYGPTETAITTHLYELSPESTPDQWLKICSVPIGKPLPGIRCYLMDADGKPVSSGDWGELYIGGPGLARGYLNQPDLTAEKFVPSAEGDGGRVFKTGDWVRLLKSGDFEFQRRIDDQVKLRGYRIETGEIEMLLQRHPSIRMAVVVVREDPPFHSVLAAYYTLRPHHAKGAHAQDLREYLMQWLPPYMIPTHFIRLESLPLLPNGKIHRAGLPEPARLLHQDMQEGVAPRTPGEEDMAGLWKDLLHLDTVSVQSNFFDLGGQSLLATRLMSRVSRLFQVDLPQRALFEHPTIERLTRFIEDIQAQPPEMELRAPDSSLIEGEL